jgi:hypothetical protein
VKEVRGFGKVDVLALADLLGEIHIEFAVFIEGR